MPLYPVGLVPRLTCAGPGGFRSATESGQASSFLQGLPPPSPVTGGCARSEQFRAPLLFSFFRPSCGRAAPALATPGRPGRSHFVRHRERGGGDAFATPPSQRSSRGRCFVGLVRRDHSLSSPAILRRPGRLHGAPGVARKSAGRRDAAPLLSVRRSVRRTSSRLLKAFLPPPPSRHSALERRGAETPEAPPPLSRIWPASSPRRSSTCRP